MSKEMNLENTDKALYIDFVNNCEPARYKHDCNNCDYLGRYKECDLYYCDNEITVIARFSDEGADYTSGMMFARADASKPLYEAKKRAIKTGLLAS